MKLKVHKNFKKKNIGTLKNMIAKINHMFIEEQVSKVVVDTLLYYTIYKLRLKL